MRKQTHIVVRGSVQGVSFRAYTQQQAAALDLTGYVRNLPNGDVEIVAEGDEEKLNRLIAWAHRGPSLAHVRDVTVQFSDPTDSFDDFSIRY